MTVAPLDRQLRTAQRRLWLNAWFHRTCVCLSAAAGLFVPMVLVQRLFVLPIPLGWTAIGLIAAAVGGSILWTVLHHESRITAAARLDELAGLAERLSTAAFCEVEDDPFARAVVADAERICATLSVRAHVRMSVPRAAAGTVATLALTGLIFLVPMGLLRTEEAAAHGERLQQLEQTQATVKQKLQEVREIVRQTPSLEELADDLGELDKDALGKLQRPSDVRHEAVKTIDKLVDAVKQKRADADYDSVREFRKMMRGLTDPQSKDTPADRLASALSKSDFEGARKEVENLKKELARLRTEENKEEVEKLAKQLDALAKKLDQLPKSEQITQKLDQAGLTKEEKERLLEALKKQDLEQVRKQLQEKGLTEEQAKQLAKQLQQKQNAGAMAQQLAKALREGAKAAPTDSGEQVDTAAALEMAADQLGELEQLQQEMNQLDAALADLEQQRGDLDKPCPT